MTWLFEAPDPHDAARTPRARSRHQGDRPLVEPGGAGPPPNRTRGPGCGPVGTRSVSRSAAVGAISRTSSTGPDPVDEQPPAMNGHPGNTVGHEGLRPVETRHLHHTRGPSS